MEISIKVPDEVGERLHSLGVAAELSEPRAPEALRRWWDEPLGWVMLWMRHATRGELRVEAVQRRGWVREVRTRASSAGT